MGNLIAELKKDHQTLADALEDLKSSGMSSAAGREKISHIKGALLGHLRKEDSQLYPPLNKDAESDPALKRKLNMMAEDMNRVSQSAMEFFDKYKDGGKGLDFIRDFGALVGKLNIRIQWEETQLYPEYDRRHPE